MTAPKYVIVTAMDEELQPFLDRATEVGEPVQVGYATQREAVLAGQPVLLVRSGIGLVNAAGAATAAALAPGHPLVISAGTAGGLGIDVQVGDVVVGGTYINADADARAFGYVLGQVPQMPASYSGTPSALDALAGYSLEGNAVHVGTMVSSYSFVTPERAARMLTDFPGSLSTDMESVALAQTSHVHGLEFISVRGISDLCGPAGHEDFLTHSDDAADHSAAAVVHLIEKLSA